MCIPRCLKQETLSTSALQYGSGVGGVVEGSGQTDERLQSSPLVHPLPSCMLTHHLLGPVVLDSINFSLAAGNFQQ